MSSQQQQQQPSTAQGQPEKKKEQYPPPNYDLEPFISQYKGHGRIYRLKFLGEVRSPNGRGSKRVGGGLCLTEMS